MRDYERLIMAAVARKLPQGLSRKLADGPLGRRLARGSDVLVTARMKQGHRLILDLRARAQRMVYVTGSFDDELIATARLLMDRPDSVAIDVGANIGMWTVPLALRSASVGGRVVAFEPVEANVQRLGENLALNDVAERVRVMPVALSDRKGMTRMVLREDFSVGAASGNASVLIADGEDASFGQVPAPTTRLDDAVSLTDRDDLVVVKIDAEGHEDRILEGGRKTIERHRPVVFIEWNTVYHARRRTEPTALVEEAIGGLGYVTLRRGDQGWGIADSFFSPRQMDDLVLVSSDQVHDVVSYLHAAG